MLTTFTSLLVILTAALAAPLVAAVVPHKSVPEVVFLLVFGALLGPYGLGAVQVTEGVSTVSELGLAFLFLIAGYEVNPREFATSLGRTAVGTWFVSLAIGFALVALTLRETPSSLHAIALAIALTTTAYGTLVPIMRDRELGGTRVGHVVVAYGAMGEILPVLAMSLLLSPHRSTSMNLAVLAGFFVLCLVVAVRAERARDVGSRLSDFLHQNAENAGSQPTLRAAVLLLVALLALAEMLDLDAVLAAFAAGFILRHVVGRDGDHRVMQKVEVVGNGLFVPAFFVYSGLGIDFAAVGADPGLLLTFMALLLAVRAIPLGLSLSAFPETRDMPLGEKVSASLYCTMALPLIVALTEAATRAGAMDEQMASVLVTSGALSVLAIPVITSFFRVAIAAHPVEAAREVAERPEELRRIIHEHQERAHEVAERFHEERRELRRRGVRLSSADFLAQEREPKTRAGGGEQTSS